MLFNGLKSSQVNKLLCKSYAAEFPWEKEAEIPEECQKKIGLFNVIKNIKSETTFLCLIKKEVGQIK